MNRYIRNFDEKSFAKQMDDVRKTFCNEQCDGCIWSLPDDKCMLITAENHISSQYRKRMHNVMYQLKSVREKY